MRPIKLETHKVMIAAPLDLVYQMMSSFGRGRLKGDNGGASKVLRRSGDGVVVEFKTRVGPLAVTTVEEITLEPPGRLIFRHQEGPLRYAIEEFALDQVDGGTELEHTGEFIWSRAPLVGWLVGRLLIKRVFERVIQGHMAVIRAASEARARRSRVFPAARSAAGVK